MSEKNEKIDDGGPAFGSGDATNGGYVGMSLRDWFAGQIVKGFCGNPALQVARKDGLSDEESLARSAYLLADVMLKERAK